MTSPTNKLSKKERMAIPRQGMPEQEPQVRAHNFDEVPHGYPAETAIREATRCLECKKPKCIDGCPVNIDIPAFVTRVAAGDFRGAIRTIKQTNMLPAICGRVCPQETQCEEVCVLGLKHDPVAIGRLERFCADWERASGEVELPEVGPSTGKRVAVVGAGPAGLTVAIDCARAGHEVELFEALHKPGGVLVYGIPEFRLPKAIVQAEVDTAARMGVKLHYNYVVGKLETLDELLQRFDAVFLGTGAGLPLFLNIPGENLIGVFSANEYLTRSNLMKAYDFPRHDTPILRGGKVAVVGGGNVAMDSARTALRLGADKVYLVYRRSRAEMPARDEEIHHAEEEGIELHLLTNPTKILGDDKGRVTGMECLKMELGEPDASGRRRPIPVEGSEFVIDLNAVVVAIGNNPNPLVPQSTPDLKTGRWGNIEADEANGRTSIKGVFAGGDIVTGAATVILAMGAGRAAARSMNEYLETGVWDLPKGEA